MDLRRTLEDYGSRVSEGVDSKVGTTALNGSVVGRCGAALLGLDCSRMHGAMVENMELMSGNTGWSSSSSSGAVFTDALLVAGALGRCVVGMAVRLYQNARDHG